jgi:hypothetical protein
LIIIVLSLTRALLQLSGPFPLGVAEMLADTIVMWRQSESCPPPNNSYLIEIHIPNRENASSTSALSVNQPCACAHRSNKTGDGVAMLHAPKAERPTPFVVLVDDASTQIEA